MIIHLDNLQLAEEMHSLLGLEAWLSQRGVDTSNWGKDSAKTVLNLWHELRAGETTLHKNPLLRSVSAATILIVNQGRVLVEESQLLSDGRLRKRSRPPSEKVKRDETPLAAAYRCLAEELGVAARQVTFFEHTLSKSVIHEVSPSYPGLPSKYTFYTIEATVTGLPDDDFWTSETGGEPGVEVTEHFWVWRRHDIVNNTQN